MRSRFTAFASGNADYLLRSWHPGTRPATVEIDPETRWYRLEIEAVTGGGPFDSVGTVTFEAFYREGGVRGSVREHSRFERIDGSWFYVDGDVLPSTS